MKKISVVLFVVAALSGATVTAATAAESAASPNWRKAADNKILAQKLVNDTLARHPELVVLGIHATPPGGTQSQIIAINLDRIGKVDDPEARLVIEEHKIILEPNLKDPTRFEVQLWMKDAPNRQLPVLVAVVFDKRKTGDDLVEFLRRGLAIRDEMAAKLPSFEALFKPAAL
jgi:iron complex outermembrane receptor protein